MEAKDLSWLILLVILAALVAYVLRKRICRSDDDDDDIELCASGVQRHHGGALHQMRAAIGVCSTSTALRANIRERTGPPGARQGALQFAKAIMAAFLAAARRRPGRQVALALVMIAAVAATTQLPGQAATSALIKSAPSVQGHHDVLNTAGYSSSMHLQQQPDSKSSLEEHHQVSLAHAACHHHLDLCRANTLCAACINVVGAAEQLLTCNDDFGLRNGRDIGASACDAQRNTVLRDLTQCCTTRPTALATAAPSATPPAPPTDGDGDSTLPRDGVYTAQFVATFAGQAPAALPVDALRRAVSGEVAAALGGGSSAPSYVVVVGEPIAARRQRQLRRLRRQRRAQEQSSVVVVAFQVEQLQGLAAARRVADALAAPRSAAALLAALAAESPAVTATSASVRLNGDGIVLAAPAEGANGGGGSSSSGGKARLGVYLGIAAAAAVAAVAAAWAAHQWWRCWRQARPRRDNRKGGRMRGFDAPRFCRARGDSDEFDLEIVESGGVCAPRLSDPPKTQRALSFPTPLSSPPPPPHVLLAAAATDARAPPPSDPPTLRQSAFARAAPEPAAAAAAAAAAESAPATPRTAATLSEWEMLLVTPPTLARAKSVETAMSTRSADATPFFAAAAAAASSFAGNDKRCKSLPPTARARRASFAASGAAAGGTPTVAAGQHDLSTPPPPRRLLPSCSAATAAMRTAAASTAGVRSDTASAAAGRGTPLSPRRRRKSASAAAAASSAAAAATRSSVYGSPSPVHRLQRALSSSAVTAPCTGVAAASTDAGLSSAVPPCSPQRASGGALAALRSGDTDISDGGDDDGSVASSAGSSGRYHGLRASRFASEAATSAAATTTGTGATGSSAGAITWDAVARAVRGSDDKVEDGESLPDLLSEEVVRGMQGALEALQAPPQSVTRLRAAPIGRGAFASVYKVHFRGQECAAKVVSLADMTPAQIQRVMMNFAREVYILTRLVSPRVVSLHGCVSSVGELTLVMEYMRRGSLRKLLNSLELWAEVTPRMRHQMLSDVAEGMQYLHYNGIYHRDLKSHNVLIGDDFRAKLSDFGLSRTASTITSFSSGRCGGGGGGGTLNWMPPECFDASAAGADAPKRDVYSYGMVVWEVLAGEAGPEANTPWGRTPPAQLIAAVLRGERPALPACCDVRGDANVRRAPLHRGIMAACLAAAPAERPTFDEIARTLDEFGGASIDSDSDSNESGSDSESDDELRSE
ncbi:hypothetical protein JKP88DRAFT_267618 [Tribonema minus]|uniref:Protein kinase domain-containing protein n=1 Tax=Tribonema minus TaxID=303371 RepID=A0A835Z605_9STRA|nr:hypothetical protein JKP88DRAFT_267618 [Tribonema minus]